MTKTIVMHKVSPSDEPSVIADLKAEGFNTFSYLEPDGTYTVIGTQEIPGSDTPGTGPSKANAS